MLIYFNIFNSDIFSAMLGAIDIEPHSDVNDVDAEHVQSNSGKMNTYIFSLVV